jgi:hypothetical protein
MSNLSSIGFGVQTEKELRIILEEALQKGYAVPADGGQYICYSDPSGAELWMQLNAKNEFIGFNPHFKGNSKRKVGITEVLDNMHTELDGSLYAWASPATPDDPESGEYPFVFEMPDLKGYGPFQLPKVTEIQLSAFGHDVTLYDSEMAFAEGQGSEVKFAAQSFIPTGLFNANDNEESNQPIAATGLFAGTITHYERKQNEMTGHLFYWLLVETLGGPIDVVLDPILVPQEPVIGGVLHGQFWLSGRFAEQTKIPDGPGKKSRWRQFWRK